VERVTPDNEVYLQPTQLCDFDRQPEIRAKALELTTACRSREEVFQRIFAFVKELPYGLEDWDVTASEALSKGWGMCSGKTNLLVALLRSVGIPARYRVFRIKAEVSLWHWIIEDEELAQRLGAASTEQDHVDCEVWLGEWRACDPSRETLLERGLVAMGIPLEREGIAEASGRVPYLTLASFDLWARERQENRKFRENRGEVFAKVNEQFSRIRALGRDQSEGREKGRTRG
jgi:transglutaminase-like putative cysteine protease